MAVEIAEIDSQELCYIGVGVKMKSLGTSL